MKAKALVIASDHGGYALKENIKTFLQRRGIEVKDLGTLNGEDSVDYPNFARRVAEAIHSGAVQEGILICGTGIGMSIAANKFSGIRAALVHDPFTARMAREHNNANVLVLGGRVLDDATAIALVQTWLDSTFAGDRHQRRLDLIAEIERTGR